MYQGGGRFDDPERQFRVLYATTHRKTAFVETLAGFRPNLELIARTMEVDRSNLIDEGVPIGVIPTAFFRKLICRIQLGPNQWWLDLRSPETHQWLRSRLAAPLVALGITGEFDWADLLSANLTLTQAVARFAFDAGYQGLVYASSHDGTLDCWAIFEGAEFSAVGPAVAITRGDEDLLTVMRLFDLRLPEILEYPGEP